VTVTLSAADEPGGSGVQRVTYEAAGAQPLASTTVAGARATVRLTAEGVTILSYSATDRAGNRSATRTLTVRIDETVPAIVYTGNAGTYTVDQAVSITCTAIDALSGVASSTCTDAHGPAFAFASGTTTLAATATDKAGNVGTGSTTFTVRVTYDGLCALGRRFVTNRGFAAGLCAQLAAAELNARLGVAAGKAGHLVAFQRMAEAGARAGFLTAAQAAALSFLASEL
jgi:hypothetical protein